MYDVFDIPTNKNTAAVWMEWHKVLKRKFGQKTANSLFMKAWDKNIKEDSDANTSDLRMWAKDEGMYIESDSVIGDLKDFRAGIGDYIGDFFKLGKYAAIGTVCVVGVMLILIAIKVGRDPAGAFRKVVDIKSGRALTAGRAM